MPIKFGNNDISKIYFGENEVSKIYLGNTLVYEASSIVVDPILNNNSWAVIAQVCNAGQAADYWALGDTKTDLGTDGVTRTFRICDMSGMYGKNAVFEQVELTEDAYVWNTDTNTDDNGEYNNYNISNMRNTHLPSVLAKYSLDLQAVITNTTYKVSKNGNTNPAVVLDLSDKLFLPAEREIFASRSRSVPDEWDALTRFALYALPENDNQAFRMKFIPSDPVSAYSYWERSPSGGDTYRVCSVYSAGSESRSNATTAYFIAPVFALGSPAPVVIDPILENNSWETIKAVCEAGEAANYWALGDTKNISVTINGTPVNIPHAIVDMTANRYEYASDSTKHSNVVFQAVPTIGNFRFNSSSNTSPNSDTAYNGWDYSDLRASMNSGEIYGMYDSDFTALLVQVKTMAAYSGETNTLVYSSDKLFLPAVREVKANYTSVQSCEVNSEQTQYGFYALNSDADANRIKYPYNSASATYWWTRSPRSDDFSRVRDVNGNGTVGIIGAFDRYGVAPCFAW